MRFAAFGLGQKSYYRTQPPPVLLRFLLHFRDKGTPAAMECWATDHEDAYKQGRKARLGAFLVEQKDDSHDAAPANGAQAAAGTDREPDPAA